MSADAEYRLRLVAGPYDGDESIVLGLPAYLWAYPCQCHPLCAEVVHWGDGDDAFYASQPGAEEYRYSHREGVVHVYRWAQLQSDDSRRLEEALHT